MAKNVGKEHEPNPNAATPATPATPAANGAAATPAVPATPAKVADDRFRKITVPADTAVYGDKAGTQMNRKDFILLLAGMHKSRSEITKIIKGIPAEQGGGPNFRYQIVFQATKALDKTQYPHLNGGQQKPAAPAPAPAAPPPATA